MMPDSEHCNTTGNFPSHSNMPYTLYVTAQNFKYHTMTNSLTDNDIQY